MKAKKSYKKYNKGGKLTEEEKKKKALKEAAAKAAKKRQAPSAENPSANTPAPQTKPLNTGNTAPVSSPEGSVSMSQEDRIALRGFMSRLK